MRGRWNTRRWLRWLGLALLVVLALLAIGPLLAPVRPLEGLRPVRELAGEASRFATIPFDGTDGIDLHYIGGEEAPSPEAPTFVLLHGSLLNTSSWREVMGFFDSRGAVIAYDQTPYGLSEKLLPGDWRGANPYTAGAAIEQLFTLLDTLGAGEVVLVGSSYGGTLAVQAALAEPERVRALVLVDAAVYVDESLPPWLLDLPQVQRLGPLVARRIGQSESFLRQLYWDPELPDAAQMERALVHTQAEGWDQAFWEYLYIWGSAAPDMAPLVPQVMQPTLVVAGEEDAVVPVDDSRRLATELPSSELILLPSCGHLPQEECPQAFTSAVEAWLERAGLP